MLKTIKIDVKKILEFFLITILLLVLSMLFRMLSYRIDEPIKYTIRTAAYIIRKISLVSMIATISCALVELLKNGCIYDIVVKEYKWVTIAVILVLSAIAGLIPRSLSITYVCQIALMVTLALPTPKEEKVDKLLMASIIAGVVLATVVSYLASGCSTVEHFVLWQNVSEISYVEGGWGM